MTLTREHYILSYIGWNRDYNVKCWRFKGPVDITILESRKDETVFDAYERLDGLIADINQNTPIGEAPAFTTKGFAQQAACD